MAFIQGGSNTATGSTAASLTLTGVTAGNMLVVAAATGYATLTLADDRSDTITNRVDEGTDDIVWKVATIMSASGGTHVVTATPSVFTAVTHLLVAEYDPVTYANVATGSGFGDATSAGPLTPSQASVLAVGVVATGQTRTHSSWLSAMTERFEGTKLALADVVVSNTSAVTAGDTLDSSTGWRAALLLFDPSGGGGGGSSIAVKSTYHLMR